MRKYNYKYINHVRGCCNRNGGTIINLIVALVFFGLFAWGILWVIKSTGDAGGEYLQGVANTQNKASVMQCQINLRSIYQSLQIDAIANGEFPDSLEDISDWSKGAKLFRCPDPNGPEYIYIPGQRLDSPRENILFYEPEPIHNGGCNVLRVNGTIELIGPEALKAAIEQTKAHLLR